MCDCGTIWNVPGSSLRAGRTLSCGCSRIENSRKKTQTHGMSLSTEYTIWKGMRRRCYNTNAKAWKNYGGRGITVCFRWKNSFSTFYNDMGPRPSLNHTIDRIDNNGNYEPTNCRWATYSEQNSNNRRTRFVTIDNICLTVSQWCERIGISNSTVRNRLHGGWSSKRAILTPIHPKKAVAGPTPRQQSARSS
jgi:hypothetical protein